MSGFWSFLASPNYSLPKKKNDQGLQFPPFFASPEISMMAKARTFLLVERCVLLSFYVYLRA